MDQDRPFWEGKHYAFTQNKECEFFPCHKTEKPEDFNCLFCYCPLYALGPDCGGTFSYTAAGVKDCSRCTRLHRGEAGASVVKKRFAQLAELAKAHADTQTGNDARECEAHS